MFETGAVSERLAGAVRPEILASWRRSAAFGAESQVRTLPYNDSSGAAERLMVAAEPVLRSLAGSLAGLHAGVLLSDRDANIVQRWVADREIAADLDRISSDCGFGAPEDRVGTNGIGTVAELGRPQMVAGPEHYADSLTRFTCVGAPIRNPLTNRLEGIVTLSCRADAANSLLTPLIVGTASDIENRLLQSSTLSERRLLDAYLTALKRHRRVVALNRTVLMACPRGSRAVAQLVDRDRLWQLAKERARTNPVKLTVDLVDGRQGVIEMSPVHDDDHLIGVVVVLDHIETEHGTAPRPQPTRDTKVAALAEAVPGSSARWQTILESAVRLAADRTTMVVEGPQGCGKWTLARQTIQVTHPEAQVLAVDCLDLVDERRRAALADRRATPDVVVLRHIDRLEEAGAAAIILLLDGIEPATPWVVATRNSQETTSEPGQRVLDRYRFARLEVPSLAERTDDIPGIVAHLVAHHPNTGRVHLSSDAISELRRATWPGEVRQLVEVVNSALAGRVGEVRADDLPVQVRSSAVQRNLSPIEHLECEAIIKALRDANGNKMVAARIVGISRSTIYRKIRAYGIDCETTFF